MVYIDVSWSWYSGILPNFSLETGYKKMIERIEHLAARLIPRRKWLLAAFLVALAGVMPTAWVLAALCKQFWIFPTGMFLSIFGFTWTSGLFMISYWYNPDTGLLTIKQISAKHPLIRWYCYFMRYHAPAFLAIWFMIPFLVLAMCCILWLVSDVLFALFHGKLYFQNAFYGSIWAIFTRPGWQKH